MPLLKLAGHEVHALDLPSHGQDGTSIDDVTLDSYVNAVMSEINNGSEPVVLIGHSAAGVTLSSVAEAVPKQIAHTIYLCAYVPDNGCSLIDMRKRAKRQLITHAVQKSDDGFSYTIDPAKAPGIFYHDCSPESVAYAMENLGPQPILPQATPVTLGDNFNSVSKSYIICTDDHTIPPEAQYEMTKSWPQKDVYELACGHSAFFACPDKLCEMVNEILENTHA